MDSIADVPTRLAFSIHTNPGVYAVLVGSGLSSGAGIPTGWQITLDLIWRVALIQGVSDQPDWAAWYREKFGKEPNYTELVDELAPSQEERRTLLQGYIEPTVEEREEGLESPNQSALCDCGSRA